jgi:hypothetical protein
LVGKPPEAPLPAEIQPEIDDDGAVRFIMPGGAVLPEDHHLAKQAWRELGPSIRAVLEEEKARRDAEIAAIAEIHRLSPAPDSGLNVGAFPEPEPAMQASSHPAPEPRANFPPRPGLAARIFGAGARWRHTVAVLETEHERRREEWRVAERERLAREAQLLEGHKRALETWSARRTAWLQEAARRLATDEEAASAALEGAFEGLWWARETVVAFDLDLAQGQVMMDVDLPEIDDMPTKSVEVAANGRRLLLREIGQKARQLNYAKHIHGVLFRAACVAFHTLPALHCAVVSGYSQRHDPATGAEREDYLLSAVIERDALQRVDFDHLDRVDPVAAMEAFPLRRNISKTGVLKPIEPFQQAS